VKNVSCVKETLYLLLDRKCFVQDNISHALPRERFSGGHVVKLSLIAYFCFKCWAFGGLSECRSQTYSIYKIAVIILKLLTFG